MSERTRRMFRAELVELAALMGEHPAPSWREVEKQVDRTCDALWASMEDDFLDGAADPTD